MGWLRSESVVIDTDGSGDGEGFVGPVNGEVLRVVYAKDGSVPYSDGVDVDVTGDTSGVVVWDEDNVNASKTVRPQEAVHSTAGVALEYADTYARTAPVCLVDERVKVVVGSGGSVKRGTFTVVWREERGS